MIAEKNSYVWWSDYIYANGQKIARADSFDARLHMSGVNCNSSVCGARSSLAFVPVSGGYVIQSGDILHFRQFQSGSAQGGIMITFSDNTNANGQISDQDGQVINDDSYMDTWHLRNIDLSAFAGGTISTIGILNEDNSGTGKFDLYFGDIAITGTNGGTFPIYNRQSGATLSTHIFNNPSGVTNLNAFEEVSNQSGDSVQGLTTTTYYHGDQIGSTRMLTSTGGWPVSSTTFYPFGQEQNATADPNHYKFTGLERDTESGLDHAMFRQYSPTTARWMSPDPYLGSMDFANPQSFNRYSYVDNSPLTSVDPSGLLPCGFSVGVDGALGVSGLGWVALGACVGTAIYDILGFFHHPSFHGSLKPRPSDPESTQASDGLDWDNALNDHLGLPAGGHLPGGGIGGAIGLPSGGCEFGACGGGPGSFQAGAVALPAAGGAAICAAAEPCGAIALTIGATIGAIYLGDLAIDKISDMSKSRTGTIPAERVAACTARHSAEVAACGAKYGRRPGYGACVNRAQRRWSNCLKGVPDPGPAL